VLHLIAHHSKISHRSEIGWPFGKCHGGRGRRKVKNQASFEEVIERTRFGSLVAESVQQWSSLGFTNGILGGNEIASGKIGSLTKSQEISGGKQRGVRGDDQKESGAGVNLGSEVVAKKATSIRY